MTLQSTVNLAQGFGVVGELFSAGPTRAQSAILNSGDAANNVVGRYFTLSAEGVAQAGGSGAIAGILANPKEYPLTGTAGQPLAPSLTLPNGVVGDFVTMGEIIVAVPGAAAIGDAVKYNTTTGVLGTGAPGAGEAAVPNAQVIKFTPAGAGLAVIKLTN